jgi:soluble lytic murein transglycosylase-like protein/rubrerythrin
MPALIDFAALDLRAAFDFAIMIEEDAQDRYAQLASRLGDEPGGAGEIFRAMVATEGKHVEVLVARRDALFRGAAPRVEVSVLDEGVERPEVDDDELPRTGLEALGVALAAEQRAYAFYGKVLPGVQDPEVRAFFERLQQEEADHAALIAGRIAARLAAGEVPVEPRTAGAAPTAAAELFPDRDVLAEALPRFDAATRAVATGVIVDGLPRAAVAAALGVSRRTVARKLGRFLQLARQQAAIAVAAAALSGCAVGLPHAEGAPHGAATALQQAPHGFVSRVDGGSALPGVAELREGEAPPLAGPRRAGRAHLAEQVQAQVARRMSRFEAAVHERVARAVLAEATRAGLDPLLVLALIDVESAFDPHAVSTARAFGLMQLREPTFHRERQRSGLPAADPRDPVANVQAGVRYLRRLIDAFDGNVDVALIAYNAGPSRTRGHLLRGEIPARFHGYPRKVNVELSRLRTLLDRGAPGGAALVASADAAARPRG